MWLSHFTAAWTRTAYLDLISDIQVPVGFPLRVSFNCLPYKGSLEGQRGGEERKKKGKEKEERKEGRNVILSSLKLLSCLQVVSEGTM